MSEQAIHVVNKETFDLILEQHEPYGKYLCLVKDGDGHIYIVACDNTSGDAWTEDFLTVCGAIEWLECWMEARHET